MYLEPLQKKYRKGKERGGGHKSNPPSHQSSNRDSVNLRRERHFSNYTAALHLEFVQHELTIREPIQIFSHIATPSNPP